MPVKQLSIREAIEEVQSGQVYGRADRESCYVSWVLSAYAERPHRVVNLGGGRVAVCGDPGKTCRTYAGLRWVPAAQRENILDLLYQAEVKEELEVS